MNLLLALGAWIGVSVPVSLFLGGLLGRDRAQKAELGLLREHVTPTRLA